MNIIVANKQRNILDNTNIDAFKNLYGFFRVEDLINNTKNYYYTKMILDATSIIDFANSGVLKRLAEGIGPDKVFILLPEAPKAPEKFLDLLVDLGFYNFSNNIDELLKYIENPNSVDSIKEKISSSRTSSNFFIPEEDNNLINNENENNILNNKYILGIKNITKHAGSTTLIYMLKKALEKKFNKNVLCIEIDSNDFIYFQNNNMISVKANEIENKIKDSMAEIILLDLSNNNYDNLCSEVIYLVEPSIIKVNQLMVENRKIFEILEGKKVILNKSLLSKTDIEIFAHEAGISFWDSIPYLNDRIENKVISELIDKLYINR